MKKTLKNTWQYYLLLVPALALSFSVVLLPAIQTIITSFTDWNGLTEDINFIGLGNYKELFANKDFYQIIFNNIKWMSMYLVVPVLLGMTASFALISKTKSRSIYQVIYLIPYVMAPIANAIIWQVMIYSPLTGLVSVLKKAGINIASPISSTATALPGVAAVDIWHYWGFLAVIYLAALRQTPTDQIEAAKVEGAKNRQILRYIYFPNIKSTFILMEIMIVIQSFMNFEYVFLLTRGGPGKSTMMMGVYAYECAFSALQLGKASAVSLIMSLLGLAASIFYVRFNHQEEQY